MERSGGDHVRQLKDLFKMKSGNVEHDIFVMTPLGMSLRTLQEMLKNDVFQQNLVVDSLDQVLVGLNFLHEADVIHTEPHLDNLLLAITNDSVLSTIEEGEIGKPLAMKQVGDTIIYDSRYMLGGMGPLIICDLGKHT